MTSVALFKVLVRESASSIIPVSAPEYEVAVIKAIFGDENVNEYESRGTIEVDPDAEFERLCRKYGDDLVKELFRFNSSLAQIIVESASAHKKGKNNTTQNEV